MNRTTILHRLLSDLFAVALLLLPVATVDADGVSQLRASLLPAPHQIEIRGASRPIATRSHIAILFLPGRAGELDVAAPLQAVQHELRVVHRPAPSAYAERPGRWTLTLVPAGESHAAQRLPEPADTTTTLGPEDYRLETFPKGEVLASISAGGPRGLFYGAQTLAQLLTLEAGKLLPVRIEDGPDMAVRVINMQGFDKGYGGGDLESVNDLDGNLPGYLDLMSQARINVYRLHMNVGWILHADRWVGDGFDSVMRKLVAYAHRRGVEVMIEGRMVGQVADSPRPKFYTLNPLTEFDQYEAAFRRAAGWGADYIDFSYNDLKGVGQYADVVAKYGQDDVCSGRLMADLMHRVAALANQVKPGMPLYILPAFYGEVHWDRYPRALSEFWANGSKGMIMMATGCRDPRVQEARRRWDAQFLSWNNYTSNHVPEQRTILTSAIDLNYLLENFPRQQRRALISTGLPTLPQKPVLLAAGECLWNHRCYDTSASLAKGAQRVLDPEAIDSYVKYAGLLPRDVLRASTGSEAAALVNLPREQLNKKISVWEQYVDLSSQAVQAAEQMKTAARSPLTRDVAGILYWNAKRVAVASHIGAMLATALSSDGVTLPFEKIETLLREEEDILKNKYPGVPNDPMIEEARTRGIRALRAAMDRLRKEPAGWRQELAALRSLSYRELGVIPATNEHTVVQRFSGNTVRVLQLSITGLTRIHEIRLYAEESPAPIERIKAYAEYFDARDPPLMMVDGKSYPDDYRNKWYSAKGGLAWLVLPRAVALTRIEVDLGYSNAGRSFPHPPIRISYSAPADQDFLLGIRRSVISMQRSRCWLFAVSFLLPCARHVESGQLQSVAEAAVPPAHGASRWQQKEKLAIESTEVLTASRTCGKRVDMRIVLHGTFESPFDADEIAVDALVDAPSGRRQTVPAFFWQPYERRITGSMYGRNPEVMVASGPPQ